LGVSSYGVGGSFRIIGDTVSLDSGDSSEDLINRCFGSAASDLLSGSFEFFIMDSSNVVPNAPFTIESVAVTLTDPVAVPGPIAGAGLPGTLLLASGLVVWWHRRRKPF
jgi:hypothetical protein